MKLLVLVVCLKLFLFIPIYSTTWDEPWADKVIKEADSFVLAKIKNYNDSVTTIEIVKTLGGKELHGEIKITSFYLLDLCSTSGGHDPEFHFKGINESYFFIKQNKNGKYCIATPTSGFDYLVEGKVYATYRHSYHQAKASKEVYEKTMTAIFNNYHNNTYDSKYLGEFIEKYISLKPAGFEENEIETFFAQHIALESAYHLKSKTDYSKLLMFLKDTTNFHNQVSAARALVSHNNNIVKQELLKVIKDTTFSDFTKVICIWTLSEFKPTELKEQLVKISENASTNETGFGGNIMDPRVCTHFPDLKNALEELIKSL